VNAARKGEIVLAVAAEIATDTGTSTPDVLRTLSKTARETIWAAWRQKLVEAAVYALPDTEHTGLPALLDAVARDVERRTGVPRTRTLEEIMANPARGEIIVALARAFAELRERLGHDFEGAAT